MIEKKLIEKGIKFKCQGSSNCCVSRGTYGYVYLTKNDLLRFSKYFKISTLLFKKKYCQYSDGYMHLKEVNKNGNCIFLKEKKCTIYNARPTQCRTWPFWKENMNAKNWSNNIKNFCPGIGKGKKYSYDQILGKIKEDNKNEINIIKK